MALIKHDLIRHWALQQIRIEYQLGSKQRLDDIPSFKLMMTLYAEILKPQKQDMSFQNISHLSNKASFLAINMQAL